MSRWEPRIERVGSMHSAPLGCLISQKKKHFAVRIHYLGHRYFLVSTCLAILSYQTKFTNPRALGQCWCSDSSPIPELPNERSVTIYEAAEFSRDTHPWRKSIGSTRAAWYRYTALVYTTFDIVTRRLKNGRVMRMHQ